jgi:hypothetical protein
VGDSLFLKAGKAQRGLSGSPEALHHDEPPSFPKQVQKPSVLLVKIVKILSARLGLLVEVHSVSPPILGIPPDT